MTLTARTTLPVALVGITLAVLAPSMADASPAQRVRQYPACAQEDSALCVWDARHMGNGVGTSFVSGAPRDPSPRAYHVRHRIAHQLIARNNWQHAPRGQRWDTVRGGDSFVTGRRAVMSVGDTTYVIRLNGTVGTS